MRRISTLFAILLLVASARSAGLPSLGVDGAAAIDRMFRSAVDKGEIPGVVAAVVNKDRILLIATFNELDATYTTRPAKREMTIRHLLTHTSGLSYDFTSPTVLAIETKTGKDPRDLPLLFDPGTKWNYSPATAVLGTIIEKLSGQSLEEWDQTKVFRPLGMVETTYTPVPALAARLATVHQRETTGLVETPNPPQFAPTVRGDGGLVSTASDYSAFVQMLLNEGRWHGTQLLKPETGRFMTTPAWTS